MVLSFVFANTIHTQNLEGTARKPLWCLLSLSSFMRTAIGLFLFCRMCQILYFYTMNLCIVDVFYFRKRPQLGKRLEPEMLLLLRCCVFVISILHYINTLKKNTLHKCVDIQSVDI